ncbi:MAG: 2-oxoacid:acceptor oxidoreductase family protein [Propionibacteriaceae bacterium]|nr:2-oxoacid:acceptor oxidoreductase family protein [Propionibacteriaceae bacterium]
MSELSPRYPGIPEVINGNGAVAYVMGHVCGGVIGYPITPSTEIAEIFEAARAEGQLNVWGKHPFFVEAEGEHSAQSGALGAALTGGNYISNASSAQGILYALESHYVTAGKKIGGFVLQVAARVVTKHSLNVMAGHDDIYSLLPAGYTVLFGSDPQEAADLAAIAFRTSSLSLIPVANAMDGFATSHVMSEVRLPEPELLANYLGDPAGRIPCPTVAQDILFGAKGRVEYLTKWVKEHRNDLSAENFTALHLILNQNVEAIEADDDGELISKVEEYLPESLRSAWKRAWRGAWSKGTRQRVPAIVDPDNPGLAGGVQNQPDFQAGAADHRTHFASAVPSLVRQAMAEYGELTGREYSPVQRYGPENPDMVLIGLGSITHDARALLPYFESQGIRVAVVSVKLLQPFPTEELIDAIRGARQVTVLERSEDTVLTTAVKQALFEVGVSSRDLHLTTAIFGLGSHDVQPRDLIAVVKKMVDGNKTPLVYVGSQFFVKNPATPALEEIQNRMKEAYPETEAMALDTGENPPGLLPESALRIRFHSVGGYGTVATGKLLTDMLASMLGMHSKSSPKYGSEKSGAPTNFYITLSPEEVLFTNAMLEEVEVVISPDHRVFEHDRPLRGLVEGGTFILQADRPPLEVWKSLPTYAREEIRAKNIRFLVIDAFAVAKKNAPNASLETRMMGIAFIGAAFGHVDRISRGAELSQVQTLIRRELEKKFGSKGGAVVEGNMSTIVDAIAATIRVDYGQPEFGEAESETIQKVPVLSTRVGPAPGFTPARLYDPEYFEDIMGRPFAEGKPGDGPVLPGTGLFLPSGTAKGKNKGLFRRDVPVVDMEKCTACLECAIACPDSAIPNQAHEISDVIARAIRATRLQDEHKAYLLGFVDQWAEQVRAALLEDTTTKTLGEVLRRTAATVPSIPLAHLDAIIAETAAYPVARIRPIFDAMEKKQSGTGAMYSVVIDPWKCTGCLQCVDVCGPGALSATEQNDLLVAGMEATFARFTKMPNTPERFTAGAAAPGGDAKRVLMDHDNYYALAGGHGACKGCGEVTATHLLTALAQSVSKEKRAEHIAYLNSMIYSLTAKISAVEPIRAQRIERVIEHLEASLWRYEAGPTGQGPSSAVIVNSTGCSSVYASTFPFNPFTQPWVNSLFQDAQASAVGVFEGIASQYLEEIQACRIAKLELDDEYTPGVHDVGLATLTWREFTDEEMGRLPMVLTISGDGAAYDIGFGAMSRVMAAQTPIKMLVLDTGGYSNTGGQSSTASFTGQNADLARHGKTHPGKTEKRKELALLAALHPGVFVASVSTAMHSHFLTACAKMIAYGQGSGLLQVYTPCGFEQGFADDLSNARANDAVRSRMAPLFVHDPAGGDTLSERISLDGNPEVDKPWATRNLKYVDDSGQTKVLPTPFTPAEFAYDEVRFAKQFRPLSAAAPNPTPISDYVELDETSRSDCTPFIVVADQGGLKQVEVSSSIVELVEERQAHWQLLRFLSGQESTLQAQDADKVVKALREELDQARAEREEGIDAIAHALASLATAKDPSAVAMPTFSQTGAGQSAPAVDSVTPASGVAPAAPAGSTATPVAPSGSGLGPKPEGVPIWLAEEDLPKCTDCATCYQELPAIFEQTTIVVDGEAQDVSKMKKGALDSLEVTPEMEAVMNRVRDTCDAEIIQ